MQPVASTLDPSKFHVFPHVCVIDEFVMTNEDGSFAANVTAKFIDRLVARMNEREHTTGDLCPIAIGHTKDGDDTKQVVGFCRNWVQGPFFDTGKTAGFADLWVYLTNRVVVDGVEVELDIHEFVKRFPRRSGEVWPDQFEIDPLSVLGATTPARDLGMLKLSRSGSLTFVSPGDLTMPDPKKEETSEAKKSESKEDQILAMLGQILDALKGGGAGPAGAVPPGGAGGAGNEMSDEEFEKLLQEMESQGGGGGEIPPPDEKSRKGEEAVRNAGYTDDQMKKDRCKLARLEVKDYLRDTAEKKGLDLNAEIGDEDLLTDLVSLPDGLRSRQLERIVKNARPRATPNPAAVTNAVANIVNPITPDGGRRRITSQEDQEKVFKLARQKGYTFNDAAEELGYAVGQ